METGTWGVQAKYSCWSSSTNIELVQEKCAEIDSKRPNSQIKANSQRYLSLYPLSFYYPVGFPIFTIVKWIRTFNWHFLCWWQKYPCPHTTSQMSLWINLFLFSWHCPIIEKSTWKLYTFKRKSFYNSMYCCIRRYFAYNPYLTYEFDYNNAYRGTWTIILAHISLFMFATTCQLTERIT